MQISEKELSQIRKLKSRKGRNEQFRFLVEGVRAARELFSSDIQVEKIMVCKDCLTGTGREFLHTLGGLPICQLDARRFARLTSVISSQGIIAVARMKKTGNLRLDNTHELVIVAEKISDPANLGSLIRSAAAFGAKLIISADSADPFSSKVISASSGYLFKADWEMAPSVTSSLARLRQLGFAIWGGDLSGQSLPTLKEWPSRIALVIGNEAFGLSDEIRLCLDLMIKIPIAKDVESLSAPVAGGILLYTLSERLKLIN